MSEWTDRGYSEVVKATRSGELKKVSEMLCEECGEPSTHRHHEDYSKPLEVIYFCTKCHRRRHREMGCGASGRKKHYNFSRIPVGSYALALGKTSKISQFVNFHSRSTGERFKCFTYDDKRVAVFRLPDVPKKIIAPPANIS